MDIKKLRKAKGWSQIRLSFVAKVSRYRLYLHENGYVKLNTNEIEKLKQVFRNPKSKEEL
jgi:predicted transcriptional regulator